MSVTRKTPADRSRRDVLRGAAYGIGALVVLSACGRRKPFVCDDVTGLSAEQIAVRKTLAYSDHSPYPGKSCSECQQFMLFSDDACGECKVLKGPIHPSGHCKSFTAKS